MRPPIQSPPAFQSGDPIAEFGNEHLGRKQAQNPTALQAEVDGIREAVRLNWLDMERLELSETERRAIRANVGQLIQTLARLLGLST